MSYMKTKPNGTGGTQVRLDPKSHKAAKNAAQSRGMLLYAWVTEAINEKLEREGKRK